MPQPNSPNDKPDLQPTSEDGLPAVAPDAMEAQAGETLDNIVPTRGYRMAPMVALGGSAGAIGALQQFFRLMPPDSGIVFVVILHLSPEHESLLPDLLGNCTSMRVLTARDGIKVEANCVYVIPPGKHLTTVDGHLRLDDISADRGRRVAVDLFFRSLADTHGAHGAAVVLSGADSDGAIGIKRIKERGGLTIAQDPDEAEHSGMPRSAISTGMVDWVLRVAEIPARLAQYFAHEHRLRLPPEEGPQPAQPTGARSRDEDEAALRDILSFLRARTGRDFSYYKRATIVRRISRRLQINNLDDLPAYLGFLRTHQGEAGALLQDLLISVTNFFRDREAFEALERWIPQLFANKTAEDAVRVWTPACATGEETYTLAMLLLEHARTLDAPPALQVFGCDLDDVAIQVARAGVYPDTIAADISEHRLKRFFTSEHRGFKVRREVREIVLFAQHDLLKDAPFSRLDLISCRNLLIYLNRDAQRRVMDIFNFSLRPHGLLFLGSSEAVDDDSPLFEVVDKRHRIYRQRPAQRMGLPVPLGPGTLARAIEAQEGATDAPVLPAAAFDVAGGRAFRLEGIAPAIPASELHFRLLERLAPPSAVINGEHDVVHLSEHAGDFLQVTGGEPSRNLLRLVHPLLRAPLHAALVQAAATDGIIEAAQIPFDLHGMSCAVDLRVAHVGDIAPDYLLVTFQIVQSGPGATPISPVALRVEPQPMLRQLERELETQRARARDSAEQYEASAEELKASNEELQAMNEELRSASEELETSREEMQSINEELTTVNHELKGKVDELAHANSDLHNLMNATAIATVFLDRALRITRYTPNAVELFNLIPSDVGRPLADLARHIDYPGLEADAARVLEQLTPIEREVGDHGRWFLVRILPYRTTDDRIAGTVLSFIDITARRQAEQASAADHANTELLGALAATLVTEQDSGRFFEEILSAAIRLSGSDAGTIQAYDPATEELVLLVARGFDAGMTTYFHRVGAASGTACGVALRNGERTYADYDEADTNDAAVRHVQAGYRSTQATPLISRSGALLGMLNTHWRASGRRLSEREVRFMDLLARQAADLMEQRTIQQALRRSEHLLRAMADNLPGGAAFIVDTRLQYQLAAGEAFVAAGFRPEQFLGRTVEQAVGPDLAAQYQASYRKALAGESFVDTHDAHGRHFETRGVPLTDADGQVTGVLAVSFDITERRRLEQQLEAIRAGLEERVRERTGEVEHLLHRLISAQEEERRRIGRNIHDQLGQQLTALRMGLEVLRTRTSDSQPALEMAERIQTLAEELDHSIDDLTWELRPPALEHFGLATALRNLVLTWSERSGVAADVDLSGDDSRLPEVVEVNMYRLAQEGLHNIAKHAQATRVTASVVRSDRGLVLTMSDDGRGFDPSAAASGQRSGLGLISMRERAVLAGGRLTIESKPGAGTTLTVRLAIPVAPGDEA